MSESLDDQLWPYSARNGVDVASDVESLLSEPEIQLDHEALTDAYAFAKHLVEGKVPYGPECKSEKTLKQVNDFSVTAETQTFYLDYFQTKEGKEDLAEMGLAGDYSKEELRAILNEVSYVTTQLNTKARKNAASKSASWREARFAEYLAEDSKYDTEKNDLESVTVNYQPEKLLEKLEDLQAYRRFYMQIRAVLKLQAPSDLVTAKSVLLDVHIARVNNLVAGLYENATNLARQIDASQGQADEEILSLEKRLTSAVALLRYAREADAFEAFADGLARRLDLVRNGAALDAEGKITPVSQELVRLMVAEISDAGPIEPQVTPKQLEAMDRTIWTGDQMKDFNEIILCKWGLLSEYHATWEEVEVRDGPAPDGKWQYVIDKESRKSLGVNGLKKVVFGPQKFGRTLTNKNPAGGLPVSAHELVHVIQNEYDEALAKQIPLAEIKGARYVAVREMGGIMQENILQRMFGRTRTTNFHYLRALQTKLQGGNIVETARTFYESYTEGKELSEAATQKSRELAVNRALRLFRKDGHESQPLDYAEQDLIAQALDRVSDNARSVIAIAGGSFSLRHAAALHRVGLLEIPNEVSVNPADDVWELFVKGYLPNLK